MTDPALLAAFTGVPRAEFVPYFFEPAPDKPGWVLVEPPDPTWRAGVDSERALITQINGDDTARQRARSAPVEGTPTSSSSAPDLMSLMISALDLYEGHRVLEIGTGTGYNAAILAHRLGPASVVSIDVDPDLIARARRRLQALGLDAHLEIRDGLEGCPSHAPFDRLLATVAVDHVPDAWIHQIRVGGRAVVPLDRGARGGLLAALDVGEDSTAHGRFLPDFGGFMSLRAYARTATPTLPPADVVNGPGRTTSLPVDAVTDPSAPFEFFSALRVGGFAIVGVIPDDGGPTETWLLGADGTWVRHVTTTDGAHRVHEGGPRHLWHEIEHAHREWTELGQPGRARFGLTVRHGDNHVWLDEADGATRWTLTPRR